MMKPIPIVATIAVLVWPFLGLAQQSDEEKIAAILGSLDVQTQALSGLKEATTLHCVLGPGYLADWRSGVPVLEQDEFSQTKDPTVFYSIDLKKGAARMMGNAGTGELIALPTASGVTFVEITGGGSVHVTTVFATYKKGTQEYPCVHSRHILMPTVPLPAQYHGTCTVPK